MMNNETTATAVAGTGLSQNEAVVSEVCRNSSLQNFPNGPRETDKTDKTDEVSNSEFLHAVFGSDLTDTRPVVVSFRGDPGNASPGSWRGKPWLPTDTSLDSESAAHANNYFTLATFRPNEKGQYERKKKRCHALYAVMLDDIGSKVATERLTLPPSWLLETSQGNYQAGYLLMEPLTDGENADRLVDAFVKAGLCDPGANGPRTRLARLPRAKNGKHSPPFPCRMTAWNPDRHYSVEDLINGFQLAIEPAKQPIKRRSERSEQDHSVDAEVTQESKTNIVLDTLRERGLYKKPLGEGKHDITCPWVDEHTNAVDSGTAYFEPDENYPTGGFKCMHGHCNERQLRDLLHKLEIELDNVRSKPAIVVVPGQMHYVVEAAEQALAGSKQYYQRGGVIVTIVTDPGTREIRVQAVSPPALMRVLSKVADWARLNCKDAHTPADPPTKHVNALFAAGSYAYLPVLNGLTHQPYLRPDGSLMSTAGYDAATGMFGVFDPKSFSVPDAPTRANAEAALAMLKELLEEFSFASDFDQTAALAAILTATIRPSLPQAPMFHVLAHMIGSGKSYLCSLITAFAMPHPGMPTTFPADDEECRKLLLAELLQAPAVIEFDNLTRDLAAHKSLCIALTSEFLTGRLLGVSKTATVSTRALFLSSGNNVIPVQDMTRRCVTICLDPAVEIPASRSFKQPSLVGDVLRDRGRYVSAALTIVRAWMIADSPKTPCKKISNYDVWSDLCRQPLLWLGCADPATSVFTAVVEDPDRETLGRLLQSWYFVFQHSPQMVRDVIKYADEHHGQCEELLEVFRDIAEERGDINRRKLGWWLRKHQGQIVDGLRLAREKGSSSAEKWKVETVM